MESSFKKLIILHYFAISCKIFLIYYFCYIKPLFCVITSKSQLMGKLLISLLEKQRYTFTDQYCPLFTIQEIALKKANNVVVKSLESLKRNHSRKKVNTILNDIKNYISLKVFVLYTLATNPSTLGTAKLGDYISTIGR